MTTSPAARGTDEHCRAVGRCLGHFAGFELQIDVNHLGHFALTGHLVDLVVAAGAGRVVTVSSLGHVPGRFRFDDLNWQRRYSPWEADSQSKLANLLFTGELTTPARRPAPLAVPPTA